MTTTGRSHSHSGRAGEGWHEGDPDSFQAPKANAHAERWLGSARRECLDWLIIRGRRHLESVLEEYVDHHNTERPHRGLQLLTPKGQVGRVIRTGEVSCRWRLGGLLREYSPGAAA